MAFTGTHFGQVSVTSGYWSGSKGSETLLVDSAGNIGSGRVNTAALASGIITLPKLSTTLYDYGTTGQSGHITSISTRLTTISWAHVNNKGPLATANSGIITHIDWSGGAIDIYKYAVTGSAATSSQVVWSVWGA